MGFEKEKEIGILTKISSAVSNLLESAFYRLGWYVGLYPVQTILLALVLTGVCGAGLLTFDNRTGDYTMWVPTNSPPIKHQDAIEPYFATRLRMQSLIFTADNILSPETLTAISNVSQEVEAIDASGQTIDDLCIRAGDICQTTGILEIWSFNHDVIRTLTQQQILDDVNSITISPVYGYELKLNQILSDIRRDDNDQITSAGAANMRWVFSYNDTSGFTEDGKSRNDYAREWEGDFMDIAIQGHSDINEIFYQAGRSYNDEANGGIESDIQLLTFGYIIVFIYVVIGMSKLNSIEHRVLQAAAGFLAIGLSVLVSFGLSSSFGLFYSPLHTVLPFLMLGIGVDDMYVIVQSWDSLPSSNNRSIPLHERIALMLRHAGVSVTITSLTDVLAFGVGATTTLPALRSFCIFCCVGIMALYFLQATYFVAVHTLNQRRIEANRNACIPCFTHSADYKPNEFSQKEHLSTFFGGHLSNLLDSTVVKVSVIIISLGLMAGGIYGAAKLEQDADMTWFIHGDSYLQDFYKSEDRYFPSYGEDTAVYLGDIDYYNNKELMMTLYSNILNNTGVDSTSLVSWSDAFYTWMETTTDATALPLIDDATHYPTHEDDYYDVLDIFLAGDGSRYNADLGFHIRDGKRKIAMSRFPMVHIQLYSSPKQIQAQDDLNDECDLTTDSQQCFAFGSFYLINEANRAIQNELYRNLGLAFLAVTLLSLVLLAHFGTSLLVSGCVIFTLIDVAGLMYYWDLTIDTVTTVLLIIAIGLAIDYAAHVGHTWMTRTGSRTERMRKTLAHIGPAVFNGGFTTFLAFVLLAFSSSYIFKTFFKLFFATVLFGLWHGLVLLPVIFSLIGPSPYLSALDDTSSTRSQKYPHNNHNQQQNPQITPYMHSHANGMVPYYNPTMYPAYYGNNPYSGYFSHHQQNYMPQNRQLYGNGTPSPHPYRDGVVMQPYTNQIRTPLNESLASYGVGYSQNGW